ncbi:MAG: STAS domain-containing protein [Solirubrobacterales bacterium]
MSSESSTNSSLPPEAAARLKADVRSGERRADLVLRGELDLATVSLAEQAVARLGPEAETLVLDLRQLTFIDSSGLKMILGTAENWNGGPRRLFVVRGPAQVERVLELTGAAERLTMVEDPSSIKPA